MFYYGFDIGWKIWKPGGLATDVGHSHRALDVTTEQLRGVTKKLCAVWGAHIRSHFEKIHREETYIYPFLLVYNILCASFYWHKMITGYLLWQDKKKLQMYSCYIIYSFWITFLSTVDFFGSCWFSELF